MATIKTKLKYLELTIPVTITNDDYQMVRDSADSHNIRELLALFFTRIFHTFNDILFRCNKRKKIRVRFLIKKPEGGIIMSNETKLIKYIAKTFYDSNKLLMHDHDAVMRHARDLKEQIPEAYSDIVSEIRDINSRRSRAIVRIMMQINREV